MFGLEDIKQENNASVAHFVLSLMQIADQAKIIHWQTRYGREHQHYGAFYEAFTVQMDAIVEGIAGKYGKDKIKFGEAAIMVYDYEMAVSEFFNLVEEAFRGEFCQIFDRDQDSELYNLIDETLMLVNKTKYLLQFEP